MRSKPGASRGPEVALGAIRLTGGEWGGTRLFSPPGRTARPALARVRAAVFNILGDVAGARVLDVFAGTGALAFEALSRGAAEAAVCEQDGACLEAIRRSAEKLRAGARLRVISGDVFATARDLAGFRADVAFVDPPYAMVDEPAEREKLRGLLSEMARSGAVRAGATVVVEHRDKAEMAAPEGMAPVEKREYGQTALSFFRVEGG